jgi:hypothetical protein
MSPRKTQSAPPLQRTTARRATERSSLIVEGKKKVGKRSAQERSALDNRFHRTHRRSAAAAHRDKLCNRDNRTVRCGRLEQLS